MKKIRMARDGYVLISIIFYIVGIVCMTIPSISPLVLCITGGIILVAYGIVKIIGYLSDDLYDLAFQYDLACGIFLIVLGVIVLGCNLRIRSYLSPGLGLLILLDGGHRYLHINANGDIDPCVFIHYSDSNIREKTLLEALQSPMMMAYHDNQPFNDNMLRPCPMLENPDKLRAMVEKSGAHSTDLQSPETAEHLCAKCDQYAKNWKPVADELWKENRAKKGIAN